MEPIVIKHVISFETSQRANMDGRNGQAGPMLVRPTSASDTLIKGVFGQGERAGLLRKLINALIGEGDDDTPLMSLLELIVKITPNKADDTILSVLRAMLGNDDIRNALDSLFGVLSKDLASDGDLSFDTFRNEVGDFADAIRQGDTRGQQPAAPRDPLSIDPNSN